MPPESESSAPSARPRAARFGLLLFLALAAAGAILRAKAPGLVWHGRSAAAWIGLALLALLGLRLLSMSLQIRRGSLPWTRILFPAVIWLEGIGFLYSGAAPGPARGIRMATAGIAELLLVGLAIHRFVKLKPEPGVAPEDHLAKPIAAFLPETTARLAALEMVIIGSSLGFLSGGWRRPAPEGFSYHRDSALGALLLALPVLLVGDLLLLEVLLVHRLSPGWRILIHAMDLYGILWLVGLHASMRARPHTIRGGLLHLRNGFLKSLVVPLDRIESMAPLPDFDDDWKRMAYRKGALRMEVPAVPQLELRLREPLRATGLFGPGKPVQRVILSVDEPDALRAAVTSPADAP